MTDDFQKIQEWHDVDEHVFRDQILTRYQPAVLKGLVKNWPAVQHAKHSPESICNYLIALDNGSLNNAVLVPPGLKGQMFYREDMSDFNFFRNKLPVSAVLNQLARYSHFEEPPAAALQCASIVDCIPGFLAENKLPLLNESILPKLWLGNEFLTPAHFDEMHNIACVVSGKRRFTLFPPEQIANLYIGPLDYTPAGAPVSLVSLKEPDFEKYPKFRDALAAAQVAELEPGDAIFIPAVWWHHVESLEPINILVNYWWEETTRAKDVDRISPVNALLHSLLSIKDLPPEQRQAWGEIFSYYLFDPQHDATAHIPEHKHGVLGKLTAAEAQTIKEMIKLK